MAKRTKTSTKRKAAGDKEFLAKMRQLAQTRDERVEANKKFIDRLTVTR
jgi:hypothetical protein